ncbi:MAG: hypothetical protein K6G27_15800 [Lachnospiraceae bacterium]|nr:hypothetical protein [Lachnospiraceae bacterium]
MANGSIHTAFVFLDSRFNCALMFYKYRILKKRTYWVVITFDSKKILDYKCSFYRASAGCTDSYQLKKRKDRM